MSEVVWRGRFLEMRVDGKWEYAARPAAHDAAVILAITDADELVLVEQYRVPLGARCLELPAGLIGDEGPEAAQAAAARELAEETGFQAAHWHCVGRFASSPGLTSETFVLFKATGLTRVAAGGGVAGEEVAVHVVARAALSAFVASARERGLIVDVKLLAMLSLAESAR
jgi:ADP-ribose pyrophosphatase